MNKKLLIGIIAGILALVLIAVGVVLIVKYNNRDVDPSEIADLPPVKGGVITFEDQETGCGETVRIPLSIKRNPGIWGAQITIDFDDDNLEFVSVSNGDIFDECEVNTEDGKINLLINEKALENTKQNGTIATITFKVSDEASLGEYEISVNKRSSLCNRRGALVIPEFKIGTITVK